MPQFSVVMPVYNKARTLSKSLACIYGQTCRDFELIVVNDGSTDGSLELLAHEEALGRLCLLHRDVPGAGGYAACNHGARFASGRWLVFFDPDDLLLFDHLSRFADAIAQHPGIQLFVNGYQWMGTHYRSSVGKGIAKGVMTRRQALAAYARCDFIHMNGTCIRRERYQALGGFPADHHGRDSDVTFILRALCGLDAIHYDNTVTSLWLMEHEAPVKREALPSTQHPSVEVREACEAGLSRCERYYLRAATNRKILAWAVKKKCQQLPVARDLASLRLGAMRAAQLYQAISLLLPRPWFERMHLATRG
ncbi:glycosyltransferase family 2 protein [Halomonas nitroreducens]|nr:glycosyltransferase family A protein [Halomonas nitroreducens]